MAAVLAGGVGAALGHRSAAELWGILRAGGGPSHVILRVSRPSRGMIRFHCSPVPADEVTTHEGVPVTTVARTLLDLGPTLSPTRLKSVIDAAENRRLDEAVSLVELVERYPRRAGAAAIRRIVAERRIGVDVPRQELELRFAEFVERFGIPRPAVNGLVEAGGRSLEVDCVWPQAHLAVELDSRAHHGNASAFEEDRARDQALISEGWRVMRITWKQLHAEPERIARMLKQALGMLSSQRF